MKLTHKHTGKKEKNTRQWLREFEGNLISRENKLSEEAWLYNIDNVNAWGGGGQSQCSPLMGWYLRKNKT